MGKRKLNFSSFFKDNWVITLFSTMFGVIAGLYLTDYYNDKQLNDSKLSALAMVKQEINQNKENLLVYDSICRKMYHRTAYVFSKINVAREILIHKDSTEVFEEKSDGIIENIKFEEYSKNKNIIQVRGEMNLFVGSKLALLDLNDVIWESYKQTNYINVTSFNCMTALEELYQFQQENNKVNKYWLDDLMKGSFLQGEEKLNEFMLKWNRAIEMNEILLNTYQSTASIFKDCN